MKGWSQSENNTQLWIWLIMEVKSNAVKSKIAWCSGRLQTKPWGLQSTKRKREKERDTVSLWLHGKPVKPMYRTCTTLEGTGHPLKKVLKAWARKWACQASMFWREWRQKKGCRGPKSLVEQGYFISINSGLHILVKWLLSHYKGWNSISCNKMDSLIHTRSLMLKRVTEGSYWKESKQVPFPMISVLRTACGSTRSWNRNW